MAFGGDLEQQDEVLSEINMTPLVDVMLVLLIIFIITVPVLTHSVPLTLPQSAHQQTPEQDPKKVSVSIQAEGQLFWNNQLVTKAEMLILLQQAAAASPVPQIQIYGDKTVAYEHVLWVMATAQQHGLTELGFVTEPIN